MSLKTDLILFLEDLDVPSQTIRREREEICSLLAAEDTIIHENNQEQLFAERKKIVNFCILFFCAYQSLMTKSNLKKFETFVTKLYEEEPALKPKKRT